jgi:hypothetical protein
MIVVCAAVLALVAAGHAAAETEARAPDVRRPDEQLSIELFGRRLTIGGELATDVAYEGGFSLRADDHAGVVGGLRRRGRRTGSPLGCHQRCGLTLPRESGDARRASSRATAVGP